MKSDQHIAGFNGVFAGRRSYYAGLAFLTRFLDRDPPAAPVQPTVEELQAQVLDLQKALEKALLDKRAACMGESALAARIRALAADWPHLYVRYFTNRGLQDQALGRPTRTSLKPKKRKTA